MTLKDDIKVSKILIFPIKSLDPLEVKETKINEYGGLEYDRFIAFFDEDGRILTRKKEKKLYGIRSVYDMENFSVKLECEGISEIISLDDLGKLSLFMSEILGYRVKAERGFFPDSTDTPGPTLISTATLEEVASWYGFSLEETRLRFRTNIEISAPEPFWEDRLCSKEGINFKIGDVSIKGVNISRRCNVPPSDPFTGEKTKDFEKIFTEKRKEKLKPFSKEECFKGFYRLTLNTIISPSEKDKEIKVGDSLRLME